MTLPTRWIAASMLLPLLTTTLGCGHANPPTANQRETRALMASAMMAPDADARAAAVFDASTRATGELADALAAIDTAKRIVQHNLANADTTGYKSTRALSDGAGKLKCQLDLTQGLMETTNRQLDVGIQGPGFFKIKIMDTIGCPPGTGYTRNGNFFINKDGELIVGTGDGYELNPPVSIPPNITDLNISTDGVISVTKAGAATSTQVGKLTLTNFVNPEGLEPLRDGVFTATESSGVATDSVPGSNGTGTLLQGYLEQSNVDITRETLRLQFLDQWRAALLRTVGRSDK